MKLQELVYFLETITAKNPDEEISFTLKNKKPIYIESFKIDINGEASINFTTKKNKPKSTKGV